MLEIDQIRNRYVLAEMLGVGNVFLDDFCREKLVFDHDGLIENLGKSQVLKLVDSGEYRRLIEMSHFEKMNLLKRNIKLGFRTVYKPKEGVVSNMYKALQQLLNRYYKPHPSVHGFVPGRSVKTNAGCHLAKQYILTLDIKNFFCSVTQEMVYETLLNLGASSEIANILATILTLDGKLFQGVHTSPVMANLCVFPMDQELAKICKGDIVYTRYADDLTFSSNNSLPSIEEIDSILEKFNFKLNFNKIRFAQRGQKQYVTGLTVFDHLKPRVSKHTKRMIRRDLYYCKKFGVYSVVKKALGLGDDILAFIILQKAVFKYLPRLKGWIDFVNAIEPELAKKYYVKYNEIING